MKIKDWVLLHPCLEVVKALSESLKIKEVTARVLINNGYQSPQEARAFLEAKLSSLRFPTGLKDLDIAAQRISQALEAKQRIAIYSDYDVDGITSAAFLGDFLSLAGAEIDYYFPNRIKDGYGFHQRIAREILIGKYDLLIVCDCGSTDLEAVNLCTKQALDVIIVDHHKVSEELPSALALINPWRVDSYFPGKDLTSVGLIFYLCAWLRRELQSKGGGYPRLDLRDYLDLVALGTVADVAPLRAENRIFVRYGLNSLTYSRRVGIQALKEVSKIDSGALSPYHISFILAPRLNSAGRLDDAYISLRLLLTKDKKEADILAQRLEVLSEARRVIEQEMVYDAFSIIEEEKLNLRNSIVLSSSRWHVGVMGIVAAKIVEKYNLPTIIIVIDNGQGRGSARAPKGFDIYKAIYECRHYLKGFGGHEKACGITIKKGDIQGFKEAFERVAELYISQINKASFRRIDSELKIEEVSFELLKELEMLAPFGIGNDEPVFWIRNLEVNSASIVGDEHLKLSLKGEDKEIQAIGFGLGFRIQEAKGRIDLIGHLREDHFFKHPRIIFYLKDFFSRE